MNTEYMNLSNGESIVKDENGNIKQRDYSVDEDILLLENKIEMMEKSIKYVEQTINDNLNTQNLCKATLKTAPLIIGFAVFAAAIIINFINSELFIASLIAGGATSGIMLVPISLICSISLPILKKQLKKEKIKLEQAQELKQEYEKDLEFNKNRDINQKNENKLISISKKNEIELPKVEEEIKERTEEALEKEKGNQKKLVLK